MRYIRFTGGNGYCGCDFEEYAVFEDGYPDEFIEYYARELTEDNGETFSHVATGWNEDFKSEQDKQDYYENCWYEWEEITKEEYEEAKK